MASDFCHLHNHTEYSLLDGANRIPDLVARTAELGMESLAITDHGVMFGAMEFYMECQKKGIKPVIGMEAYVAPAGIHKKSGQEEKHSYHLVLLAKDLEGYRNLCKLSSIAALEGFYYKPRVDHELLRKHSKGLIATTTCLGSEVNQALLKGTYDQALEIAAMYRDMFGKENYFVELQDHGLPEQRQVMNGLIKISKDLDLKLIATNDAHYLCKTDADPHDVLLCIGTGKLVADEKRLKFDTKEFYIKSQEEMAALFSEHPESLTNTQLVAEMCNVELGKQRAAMPQPDLPDGYCSPQYLRALCEDALPRRMDKLTDSVKKRLDYELEVIGKTGYEDYFLLVREFASYTRQKGIYFGVRGSAAGSLVSYLVGITDVNPIEYDLTFERFLNPERISMPDIDMDFEDARRDEVIQYVTEKYGADHVAQIVTFGTLGAKAAIKDAGRVLGYSRMDTDKLCKAIPATPNITIKKAYEIQEFASQIDADPNLKKLVDVAQTIEGTARHCGVHAAGVVISRDPLVEYVPLYRGNDGQVITAYEMGILEKIGLLKMDFLGLSNLTVIAKTVEHVRKTKGIELNMLQIPLDDAKAYEMLEQGETTGVFQLEGGGMTRYLVQLKPNNVRELSAMVALYRPGPLDHIPRYIDLKFGRAEVEYLDERMRPILEETYGVIVYQDQVLKLVQALAGFSLGKADILRRAMGKKDHKAMTEMKVEFMQGTAANDISAEVAEKVWLLLMPFADYAFNKAHAVCYGLLAYQTAYLKANHPTEYMAALMAAYRSSEDRIVSCIEACRRLKIKVLAPDINQSQLDFTIQDGSIRFGLIAIKGIGESLIAQIIADRVVNGPFKHLYEFCERTKEFGLNRTAVEVLIKSGAFDCFEPNRNKNLAVLDGALAYAERTVRERLAGQDSLFGESSAEPEKVVYPVLPDADKPSRSESLAMEKEVMGVYLSDHPLRGYERVLAQSATHSCASISELEENEQVTLAGVISGFRKATTRKGETMAYVTVEDFSGQANMLAFPATYGKFGAHLIKDSLIVAKGRIMVRDGQRGSTERSIEIRIEDAQPLEQTLGFEIPQNSAGLVQLVVDKAAQNSVQALKGVAAQHVGDYDLSILVPSSGKTPLFTGLMVRPSEEFISKIKVLFPEAELDIPETVEAKEEDEQLA